MYRKALEDCKSKGPLVFFSPPHRVAHELGDMSNVLGAQRAVCVCRELTKRYEEVCPIHVEEGGERKERRKTRERECVPTLAVADLSELAARGCCRVFQPEPPTRGVYCRRRRQQRRR